jgi:hypothetical protein
MLTSGGRYAGGSAQDPAEGGEDTATQAYGGGGTLISSVLRIRIRDPVPF